MAAWVAPVAAAAASVLSSNLAARRNAALQREFAQNSLQWKAADAKAAGLHPLAALGASGYSASPVYVGHDFGGVGQDLSRAAAAGATTEERDRMGEFMAQKVAAQDQRDWMREQQDYTRQMHQLDLERSRVQLDLARQQLAASQAARLNQGGQVPPAAPSVYPGGYLGGPAGGVTVKPTEVPTTVKGDSSMQQGVLPAGQKVDVGRGYTITVPSASVASMDNEVLSGLLTLGMLPFWPQELGNEFARRHHKFAPSRAARGVWEFFRRGYEDFSRR
jgi:hypothetical protein